MDLSTVWTLARFELRTVLRDRRTVFLSIVLPVVLTPAIFALTFWVESQREERLEKRVLEVAVVGEEASTVRELLEAWRSDEAGDGPLRQLSEIKATRPVEALHRDELAAVLVATPGDEASPLETADGDEPISGDVLRLRLLFRADRDDSTAAALELERRLDEVRDRRRAERLLESGFPIPLADLAPLEATSVARPEAEAGAALGRGAALFVVLFLLTGGSVVAADTLAGERERGTLETLLTTAATRSEVLAAKMALILFVALVIAAVQVANLGLYVGLELIPLPSAFTVDLSAATLLAAFLLLLPLAGLTSGALLAVSGRSGSYKEFQVLFFPVFLAVVGPTAAPLLPGIELRSAVVVVPLANVAVALREVLAGRFDLPFLSLAWAVSALAAVGILGAAFGGLTTERLVLAGRADDAGAAPGLVRFGRRAIHWFVGMWAVVFLGAAAVPGLATDVASQAVVNILGVMVGGSLLLVRLYGLDPVETFRLRLPDPRIWPAVLVGAPASVLAGLGVFRLSAWMFPLPESLVEGMEQAFAVTDVPHWQVLLLLAVLPGIGEELAFRGLLLSGLRRLHGPWTAVVATSLVFAFFHFQLVRFLPVAWLAVLVGALTLLTRSIYPAMLWHALYNGLLLSAEPLGIDVEALSVWWLLAGAVLTVAAFAFALRVSRRAPRPVLAPGARVGR